MILLRMPIDWDKLAITPDASIVAALKKKKELLEANDPSHSAIRPLLIILGGGMRGVAGGARSAH